MLYWSNFKIPLMVLLLLASLFIPDVIFASPQHVCPDFYLSGSTSICAGSNVTITYTATNIGCVSTISWNRSYISSSGYNYTFGPINSNVQICATAYSCYYSCSATHCINVTVYSTANQYKDTTTCVGSTIRLYYPLSSPSSWVNYTFTTAGLQQVCQTVSNPCTHQECWRVQVNYSPDVFKDTTTCVGAPIRLGYPVNSPTSYTNYTFTSPGLQQVCQTVSNPCTHQECWRVQVNYSPDVVQDTMVCAFGPLTLYWPLSSTPTTTITYTFDRAGDTTLCRTYTNPCTHNDCWRLYVCPYPKNHFTVAVIDTFLTGEINYRVCLWDSLTPPNPVNYATWTTGRVDSMHSNCRIVTVPCHEDDSISANEDRMCAPGLNCPTRTDTILYGNTNCPCVSIVEESIPGPLCQGQCKTLCLVSRPTFSRMDSVEWYDGDALIGGDSCITVCPTRTTTYWVYGYYAHPQGCVESKYVQVFPIDSVMRDTSVCYGDTFRLTFPVYPNDDIVVFDSLTNDTLGTFKPVYVTSVTTRIFDEPGIHRICRDVQRASCHIFECMNLTVYIRPVAIIIVDTTFCATNTSVKVCLDSPHSYKQWSNGSRDSCTTINLLPRSTTCSTVNGYRTTPISVRIGDDCVTGRCYTTIYDTIRPRVNFKIVPEKNIALIRTPITITPYSEPAYPGAQISWYLCPRDSWNPITTYPNQIQTPLYLIDTTTICASLTVRDEGCLAEACTTIFIGTNVLSIVKVPPANDSLGGFISINNDTLWGKTAVDWVVDPRANYSIAVNRYQNSGIGSTYYTFTDWNNDTRDTGIPKITNCYSAICSLKAIYTGPTDACVNLSTGVSGTIVFSGSHPEDTTITGETLLRVENPCAIPIQLGVGATTISVAGDTCRSLTIANSLTEYLNSYVNKIGVEALFSDSTSGITLSPLRLWANETINWGDIYLSTSRGMYTAFRIYTPRRFDNCYSEQPRPLRTNIEVRVYYRAGLP